MGEIHGENYFISLSISIMQYELLTFFIFYSENSLREGQPRRDPPQTEVNNCFASKSKCLSLIFFKKKKLMFQI